MHRYVGYKNKLQCSNLLKCLALHAKKIIYNMLIHSMPKETYYFNRSMCIKTKQITMHDVKQS